jgi:hypothetical protein
MHVAERVFFIMIFLWELPVYSKKLKKQKHREVYKNKGCLKILF